MGTGPRGFPHYPELTDGDFIIALNKACYYCEMYRLPTPSIWLCSTPYYSKFEAGQDMAGPDWWLKAHAYCEAQGIPRVFNWALAGTQPHEFTYYTQYNWGHEPPEDGVVYGHATIAGIALQLAAQLCHAPVEVVFVGVDMGGARYADGMLARAHADGNWQEREILQNMVDYYRERGVALSSLSPTELTL